MAKTVLVLLAEGFEEIEAVTVIDVLRRAALEVTVAGIEKESVTGSHGITVEADTTLGMVKKIPDAVVLPGGMPGAENLQKSPKVLELLKRMKEDKKIIGAICAAPAVVLASSGLLDGKKVTCYPGYEDAFGGNTRFSEERVVRGGEIITSRGPGSAMEFALELVRDLVGPQKVDALKKGMLVQK